jgi:hypothetical protein
MTKNTKLAYELLSVLTEEWKKIGPRGLFLKLFSTLEWIPLSRLDRVEPRLALTIELASKGC